MKLRNIIKGFIEEIIEEVNEEDNMVIIRKDIIKPII